MTVGTALTVGNSETISSPSSIYLMVYGFSAAASYEQHFQRSAEWNVGVQDLSGWPNFVANGSWFWNGPSGLGASEQVAIGTNDAVFASGGFASTATNTLVFGSTGITNTSPVCVQCISVAASSAFWVTNATSGFKALTTQNNAWGETITLQPGDAITLTGSGGTITCSGVRGL
jgi:hypothetical protein